MNPIPQQEKIAIEGDGYAFTLLWNRDLLHRSATKLSPDYDHITKNGDKLYLGAILIYHN